MAEKYLVTSALPYANGPIHIGHLAGAYLPADIYVRFLKMNGDDVVYISGTDEHGVPITITAEKNGITPQQVVDTNHDIIKNAFAGMGINFDNFSATSREIHHETAQEFFKELHESGAFRVKEETGFYSPSLEMFLPDRYIEGTCPKCGKDGARGDQCEACGTMLTPEELVNPISKINGEKPILKPTKHFYFKLGDFQERLEAFIASHPEWKDNVKNYCKSWFKEGLRDRAITRDLKWGIKLPYNEEEFISKVMYVWFEAPIGYISSTKEWAKSIGEPEKWKEYWQNDEAKLIHFIGKDNIVFHSLVFPATIMAMNENRTTDKYNMVTDIPANEFLNIENDKISTSRDWAVWVHEYLKDYPADLLRYYLTIISPENSDSDFTWEGFQKHANGELADIIGNYVNRLLTFTVKNFDGQIPEPKEFTEDDLEAFENVKIFFEDNFYPNLTKRRGRRVLIDYLDLFRTLNKYFNDMAPWKAIKTDKERCGTVLYCGIKLLKQMSVMMFPYMPESASKIWELIGEKTEISDERWDTFLSNDPVPGTALTKPKGILFAKIEDDVIEAEKAKLVKIEEAEITDFEYPKEKEAVEFDDFMKLDIRSGTIIEVEPVKKSKKLYKMKVDIGYETRTVMGGLKKAYTAEELLGKNVTVLVNLKPRMIMGVESQGMLLAASDDNNLSLLDPGTFVGNGRTIG